MSAKSAFPEICNRSPQTRGPDSQLIHIEFKTGTSASLACSVYERNNVVLRTCDRPRYHRRTAASRTASRVCRAATPRPPQRGGRVGRHRGGRDLYRRHHLLLRLLPRHAFRRPSRPWPRPRPRAHGDDAQGRAPDGTRRRRLQPSDVAIWAGWPELWTGWPGLPIPGAPAAGRSRHDSPGAAVTRNSEIGVLQEKFESGPAKRRFRPSSSGYPR
jgi:hypothetical protein